MESVSQPPREERVGVLKRLSPGDQGGIAPTMIVDVHCGRHDMIISP